MHLILIAISFFIFRSILFNPTTNLLDWNDYPLYVWILFQNIFHIKSLDFVNIFNGNIFYPLNGTLLFSDLFLPQSLIALPFTFFTKNPILIFNFIFFITLVLNVFAVNFFWKNFTKNKLETFFASLITLFSAFMFTNKVHFQMLSIWPFFFGLGYLFKEKNYKNICFLSFWVVVQFYTGIYLGIFMLFIIGLYYVWELFLFFLSNYGMPKKNWQKLVSFLQYVSVFLGIIILFIGPLALAYLNVRLRYNAERKYSEYVYYSADLTDYIFPVHLSSIVTNNKIIKKWNSYAHRSGLFPGFATIVPAFFGLFILTKVTTKEKKKIKIFGLKLNKLSVFFLGLIFIGFIFSIGPRLHVNGVLTSIPLPYHFILKLGLIFEVVRVPARWSLLLFIGLIYFATLGIGKIKKNQSLIIFFLSLFFILELIPLKVFTQIKNYYPTAYKILENKCQNKVLLEYPMSQFKKDANVVSNLTYRTQTMLASIHHRCSLINGYTGFIPNEYIDFENKLFDSMEDNNKALFMKILQQKNINFFKLNKKEIFSNRAQKIEVWINLDDRWETLFRDESFLIVKNNN